MGGNPKTSKWWNVPRSERHKVELVLTAEALAILDDLGRQYGSRSALIRRILLAPGLRAFLQTLPPRE